MQVSRPTIDESKKGLTQIKNLIEKHDSDLHKIVKIVLSRAEYVREQKHHTGLLVTELRIMI